MAPKLLGHKPRATGGSLVTPPKGSACLRKAELKCVWRSPLTTLGPWIQPYLKLM